LAGAVFLRGQHRELGFPVPEDMGLHTGKFTNLTDLEKQFLRNCGGCLAHIET
jgi:hypothetical protein